MNLERLRTLLQQVKNGELDVLAAADELATLPFDDLGHSVVDHHRAIRTGFPEVIFGLNKTPSQIVDIARAIADCGQNVLVTRVDKEKANDVIHLWSALEYRADARCLVLEKESVVSVGVGPIAVVTAGTSDLPVAAEAALVATLAGNQVMMIPDVGVAGVHRVLHRLEDLRRATVIIVVAGMEGALPSVVAGLVSAPVIAVPTSVGYGVSQGGFTALMAMLSSCASGITVVNIDNGFGAGYAAALMNRIGKDR